MYPTTLTLHDAVTFIVDADPDPFGVLMDACDVKGAVVLIKGTPGSGKTPFAQLLARMVLERMGRRAEVVDLVDDLVLASGLVDKEDVVVSTELVSAVRAKLDAVDLLIMTAPSFGYSTISEAFELLEDRADLSMSIHLEANNRVRVRAQKNGTGPRFELSATAVWTKEAP